MIKIAVAQTDSKDFRGNIKMDLLEVPNSISYYCITDKKVEQRGLAKLYCDDSNKMIDKNRNPVYILSDLCYYYDDWTGYTVFLKDYIEERALANKSEKYGAVKGL